MRSTFGLLRSRLRMSKPAPPSRSRSLSVLSAIACNSAITKRGMISWLSRMLRFDQVGDPTVDDHARIEHVRLDPFHLLGKFHVGNDEAKVIFGLQEHADADVTQRHGQEEFDDRKVLALLQVIAQHERFEHDAQCIREKQPDQNAEIDTADDIQPLMRQQNVPNDQPRRASTTAAKNKYGCPPSFSSVPTSSVAMPIATRMKATRKNNSGITTAFGCNRAERPLRLLPPHFQASVYPGEPAPPSIAAPLVTARKFSGRRLLPPSRQSEVAGTAGRNTDRSCRPGNRPPLAAGRLPPPALDTAAAAV